MRATLEQLSNRLQKGDLAPVYLITGDEPLQMQEASDFIRNAARRAGAERTVMTVDKGFEWNQLIQESASMSLFSGRRLIELRMNDQSPGKEGSEVLSEYAEHSPPDTTLLVTMEKLDKRSQQSRWYKAIDKVGIVMQIWPIEPSRLPDWIVQRFGREGKKVERGAAALIAQRTEGNLLAARQEIDKLCLLVDAPEITVQHVQDAVVDSTRYGVFMLLEYAMLGDTTRIATMMRGLRQEGTEPMGLFGAIMWELRRLCAVAASLGAGASRSEVFEQFRIWNQRQTAVNKVLGRLNQQQLEQLLNEAVRIDRALKGAMRQDPWEMMESLLFRFAGVNLHPANPR